MKQKATVRVAIVGDKIRLMGVDAPDGLMIEIVQVSGHNIGADQPAVPVQPSATAVAPQGRVKQLTCAQIRTMSNKEFENLLNRLTPSELERLYMDGFDPDSEIARRSLWTVQIEPIQDRVCFVNDETTVGMGDGNRSDSENSMPRALVHWFQTRFYRPGLGLRSDQLDELLNPRNVPGLGRVAGLLRIARCQALTMTQWEKLSDLALACKIGGVVVDERRVVCVAETIQLNTPGSRSPVNFGRGMSIIRLSEFWEMARVSGP